MASHDDLALILNQLLKSMDKMGDSLSVVKSIGEDVKAIVEEVQLIKDRLQKIEERVSCDQLPTKSEVLSIKKKLDNKLTPMDKVSAMEEVLGKIEERISNLRIDETPSKSDLISIKENLDRKLKPLDQIEVINERISRLERSMATIRMEAANPPKRFDSTKKGRKVLLTNDGMCAERIQPLEDYGVYTGVFSDVPLLEDKLFQIRIEKTIDKWSHCGISIGVICEKEEAEVEGAHKIFLSIKGTWAINSYSMSTFGTSDIWKDNEIITPSGYPLDTRRLKVGTVLGIKLCRNGDLRFFLNGEDKGVAFQNVPRNVYAFVDIVKYVTKISVVK